METQSRLWLEICLRQITTFLAVDFKVPQTSSSHQHVTDKKEIRIAWKDVLRPNIRLALSHGADKMKLDGE